LGADLFRLAELRVVNGRDHDTKQPPRGDIACGRIVKAICLSATAVLRMETADFRRSADRRDGSTASRSRLGQASGASVWSIHPRDQASRFLQVERLKGNL
jgi:hypothetical protein